MKIHKFPILMRMEYIIVASFMQEAETTAFVVINISSLKKYVQSEKDWKTDSLLLPPPR